MPKKSIDISRASRPKRWEYYTEQAAQAIDELIAIKDEYQDWLDNLPENLQSSAVADKLNEIVCIDFDSAQSAIEEAVNADLPLGFGRD